jgi:hypothetical protein
MLLRSDSGHVDIATPLEWSPDYPVCEQAFLSAWTVDIYAIVKAKFWGKFLPAAATQSKNLNNHIVLVIG